MVGRVMVGSVDNVDRIAAELERLEASDFDLNNADADGMERLVALCDDLVAHGEPHRWALLLYALLERLDTVDLGSPGPVVHALETWREGYRQMLVESVRRKPTPLTMWMVNRVSNAPGADSDEWMALLADAAEAPGASSETRDEARAFLEYQLSRE